MEILVDTHQSDGNCRVSWYQTLRPDVACNVFFWSYNSEVKLANRSISDTYFWSYNSK
jgi:hypothetical protein